MVGSGGPISHRNPQFAEWNFMFVFFYIYNFLAVFSWLKLVMHVQTSYSIYENSVVEILGRYDDMI